MKNIKRLAMSLGISVLVVYIVFTILVVLPHKHWYQIVEGLNPIRQWEALIFGASWGWGTKGLVILFAGFAFLVLAVYVILAFISRRKKRNSHHILQ